MAADIPAKRQRRQRATARIDARLTPEQKAVIQHAADRQGRAISDFVIAAAYEAAQREIREHEIISLSAQESQRFAEALIAPPEPGEHLRAAARRYRVFIGE
ncbi:MAG TPA: DUF1778 domain-containing protein [Thermomicrobiales bacterium]|nr:DUF1778 domain-containing protein [Thermomicrobiales bacterium]